MTDASKQTPQKLVKPKPRSWPHRILIAALAIIVFIGLAIALLWLFIQSRAGAHFIETQVGNRNFGRVERVEISDLTGNPLGAMNIGTVKIYDKDGLWLSANSVNVQWDPWALKRKSIALQSVDIQSAILKRRPKFNPKRPNAKPSSYSITLEKGYAAQLAIEKPVIGQAAKLELDAVLKSRPDSGLTLLAHANRLDSIGDVISLDFTRSLSGDMSGVFDLKGNAGGLLTQLLKAPKAAIVSGSGNLSGTMSGGTGALAVTFDDDQKIDMQAGWDGVSAKVSGTVLTGDWPLFDPLRAALGDTLDVQANLGYGEDGIPFAATIKSGHGILNTNGNMGTKLSLPQQINLSASSQSLSALLPQSQQTLKSIKLGAVQIGGQLNLTHSRSFDGTFSIADIETPYGGTQRLSGDVKAAQTPTSMYKVSTNITADDLAPTIDLPFTLGDKTRLTLSGLADIRQKSLHDIALTVSADQNVLKATGQASLKAARFDLHGQINAQIKAISALPSGEVRTDYSVKRSAENPLNLTIDGAYLPSEALKKPLDFLFASGVNFSANVTQSENGFAIHKARVRGENINIAATGTLADQWDVSGEAQMINPLVYHSITLPAASMASFAVNGALRDPDLKLDGQLGAVQFAGTTLNDARLLAQVKTAISAPGGPLRFTADTKYGPVDLSTKLRPENGLFNFSEANLAFGPLNADGNMIITPSGLIASDIALNYQNKDHQSALARIKLSHDNDVQHVDLAGQAEHITLAAFAFDRFSINAKGTLDALSGSIEAKGYKKLDIINREFSINAPLSIAKDDDGLYRASLTPQLDYGPIKISAKQPILASYQSGDIHASADMDLSGAPLRIRYDKTNGVEKLLANADGIAMRILPLPSALADTRGRVSANIDLGAQAGIVTGTAKFSLADWRGGAIDPGYGITAALDLSTNGSKCNWTMNANDQKTFVSQSRGSFSLLQATSIASLRINMTAPLSGTLTTSGSMQSLLELITPKNSKPKGNIDTDIAIAGTLSKPIVSGHASGSDIEIEFPTLGTKIEKARFKADFSNSDIAVSDVFVSDNKHGTLTGDGHFRWNNLDQPLGKLELQADNFRALHRKDVTGTVSGTLSFESLEAKSMLKGDVTIDKAELKDFISGNASVVELEVEEIHVPPAHYEYAEPVQSVPLDLDVSIKAPRRIFIRTRGLDIELSADAKIVGTLDAPQFEGRADLLRGFYRIAGNDVDFEKGSVVFDGPIEKAKIEMLASADTSTLSAQLKVGGTVGKPEINLSSTPERPQDEILSALLFGRSATELSGLEAAQLAANLTELSGKGGNGDLLGGLRDTLGIGQLSIGVNDDGDTQVSGGRYLSRNVYVQVYTGGNANQSGTVIDWEVFKNVSLRSELQADSETSFSLKWNKDF